MSLRLYLDANASEPLRAAARAAVLAALDLGGNPSSVHVEGRAARRLLEESRAAVARAANAPAAGVIFTSGATEANLVALDRLGRAAGRRLVVSAAEHDSLDAPDAARVPVGGDGRIDPAALAPLLDRPSLVALHLAHNETGVIQDFSALAAVAHAHGALVHADAAQAPGRIGFDLVALGADSMTLSAHKAGGPQGAGALLLRSGLDLPPAAHGGGQEGRRRPGTPALPSIAGFAAALAEAAAETRDPGPRDAIEAALGARGIVAAAGAPRLPNTLCLALPGVEAQTQVAALDLAGIAVSAGAACSSGRAGASRALAAMGFAHAASAIRVSLPWNAPANAAKDFIAAWLAMADRASRRAA